MAGRGRKGQKAGCPVVTDPSGLDAAAPPQVTPDLKPEPRVKDPDVYKQFHRLYDSCLACGNRHITAAHLLGGNKREDVLAGLVPLCGGGTSGCHGAWHGNPYRGDFGHYFTTEFVKSQVAYQIRGEGGDDWRDYLVSRLGEWGAELYLLKLEGAA